MSEGEILKVADLSAAVRERILSCRYDSIVEKHEGPLDWEWRLDPGDSEFPPADFLLIAGQNVLLPIGRDHHANVTPLRWFFSEDREQFVVFLKDTTFVETSDDEFFSAGFVAICEKFPEENFYLATLYHEWFMVSNAELECVAKAI